MGKVGALGPPFFNGKATKGPQSLFSGIDFSPEPFPELVP